MGEGPGGDLRSSRATTHPRRPRASLSSQLPSVPFRGHDGSVPVHQGEPLGGAQSRVLSIPLLLPTPSRSPVGVAGLPWTDWPAWDQVTDLPLPHRQQPGEPLRRRQAPCHAGLRGGAAWRPPLAEHPLESGSAALTSGLSPGSISLLVSPTPPGFGPGSSQPRPPPPPEPRASLPWCTPPGSPCPLPGRRDD